MLILGFSGDVPDAVAETLGKENSPKVATKGPGS